MATTEPVSEERLKKIIDATRSALTPYVSKPEMLEKYLPKPPFGFLQMVIREVIEKSGYAEGLFTPDELNEKLKKEKEEKLDFLKKIINCVILTMRKNLAIKPMKVAAGLEPDKTNLFLRMLVECAKNKDKYEWQKVVARIKSGQYKDVTERPPDKPAAATAPTTTAPQQSTTTAATTAPATTAPSTPTTAPEKTEETENVVQQQSTSRPSSQVPQSRGSASRQSSASRRPSSGARQQQQQEQQREDTDHEETPENRAEYIAPRLDSSQMMRPSTARPAPPKLKNNIRSVDEQGSHSRAASADVKNETIVVEQKGIISGDQNDDDDDGIIIENSTTSETNNQSNEANADQPTGFLVDQLRNQKGQRMDNQSNNGNGPFGANNQSRSNVKRTGIVLKTNSIKSVASSSTSFQTGGNSQTEVSKLRTAIQTLCTKTNPLGKTMEYIQEDLDVMQRELEQWRKETVVQKEKLAREKEKTEEELKSVKVSIFHIDHKLETVLEKIRSTKANILRGDAKIEKLLRNVVSQ